MFNEICYERFYSHFGRGDNRKGIVWIGGGVGYLSKTVIYSLFDREAVQVAQGIFKGTLSEKIFRQHKHDKDRSLECLLMYVNAQDIIINYMIWESAS